MANKNPKVWTDLNYIRCYQMAQTGMPNMKIAKAIGVTYKTFKMWLKKNRAFRETLKQARENLKAGSTFKDYIYNKLDYKLRLLWDQIEAVPDNATEEIEAILADQGTKVRQRLFLHALVTLSFNPSDACSKVNVTTEELKKWLATDVEFANLMEEIHVHKKNFAEGGVFKLAKEGHPGAIMYLNDRLNEDRGYGKKVKVTHAGSVEHAHTHQHVSVDDLDLSLETRKELLAKMRQRRRDALGYEESELPEGEFKE